MAIKKLRQYILYNLGIWFATALTAILLIVAVREYGTQVTARRAAEKLLVEANALLLGDAAFECQRAIEEAVRVYPPITAQVTEQFRGRLLGLPVVYTRVRGIVEDAPEKFSPRTRALLDVLNSPAPEAAQALAAAVEESPDPDLKLWHARLALDQGDVRAAAQAYASYWQAYPDRRQSLRRELTGIKNPDPAAYSAMARRLFQAGMWTETFGMVELARRQGIERPSFGYYDGVKLEIMQKPEEAAAAYEKLLATTPDYRPALLALARLQSADLEANL